ncbi:helix-turn-helix domain-containing protein [Sphaerisporangium aureirubrum]|uniref:Helix-turn-helix domain-containing protein n=1 Tax=Sphaerisporangium aureirubrum TaxID=1544736 RepID=A0ABW1NDU8_9ACTN
MAPPRRLSLPFNGVRARHEREQRGLTAEQLAQRCEEVGGPRFAHTTILRWEAGVICPTAPNAKVLADALGVTVRHLCTPPDEPPSTGTADGRRD